MIKKSLDIQDILVIYLSMLNNNSSNLCKRKKGFTLIEMLVVIAIIVLLASLLQPAIQNTLARARITGCISNLNQQGSALVSYTVEHKGRLPQYRPSAGGSHFYLGHEGIGWERTLAPYIIKDIPEDPNIATGSRVFICPASSVTWDPTLTYWGHGPGNYRHRGIPAGPGNNTYRGLYYNYMGSSLNLNQDNPYDAPLRMNFYVTPSLQPVQWCSTRLSPDPTIEYNTNGLARLSWHEKIVCRPTLFLDGRVEALRRDIHNTLGEQVMLNAKHPDNINYNTQRNIHRYANGGTFAIRP